jgi:sugar phosphate isomerase/epimerase
MNRRTFARNLATGLLLSGLAPMTARIGAAGPRVNGRERMVRLGGPVFVKTDDPDELARAHRKLGYRAAYCPVISLTDNDRITATIRAFSEQGVVLAEVGRWCNLLDPDPAKRKKNLDHVVEGLALAEAVGALCCVDIAGSFNPKIWYGPHPENLSREFFDAAVENARKIIDAVQPLRSKFCYEMMGWALPDSPDSYFKMIKAVDRKAFAAHLDPCNLINCPERYYQSTTLLNECFRKLGPHIVSCHAKDLSWNVEMNLHFREVRPGEGELDYQAYLRLVSSLGQTPPLMLEHLPNAQEYDLARAHLVKLGEAQGISM